MMRTIDTMHTITPTTSRLGAALIALVDKLEVMSARRRSRAALLELNDAQLKDIGISRAEAHGEGMRPFWD